MLYVRPVLPSQGEPSSPTRPRSPAVARPRLAASGAGRAREIRRVRAAGAGVPAPTVRQSGSQIRDGHRIGPWQPQLHAVYEPAEAPAFEGQPLQATAYSPRPSNAPRRTHVIQGAGRSNALRAPHVIRAHAPSRRISLTRVIARARVRAWRASVPRGTVRWELVARGLTTYDGSPARAALRPTTPARGAYHVRGAEPNLSGACGTVRAA